MISIRCWCRPTSSASRSWTAGKILSNTFSTRSTSSRRTSCSSAAAAVTTPASPAAIRWPVSIPPTTTRTSFGPTASSFAGPGSSFSPVRASAWWTGRVRSGAGLLNAPSDLHDPASSPGDGLAPEPLRARALAGTGAGQPGHPDFSSAPAHRLPGADRLRAARVEPLAARRPAHPVEPQLRGFLSAELARRGGTAGLCPEPAGDPAYGHRFRGGVVSGAPARLRPGSGGAGGRRVLGVRRLSLLPQRVQPLLGDDLASLGAGLGGRGAGGEPGATVVAAGAAGGRGAGNGAAQRRAGDRDDERPGPAGTDR